MKAQFTAVAAIALFTAIGTQTVVAADADDDATVAMFKKLDTDNDGYVTLKEANANPDILDSFSEGDSNDDNKLSLAEFKKMKVE